MNRLPRLIASLLLVVPVAACAGPDATDAPAPAPSNVAAPVVSGPVLAVEQAIRDLDVGRDAASVRARLEAALADATLPPATRDEATLALARALDLVGDEEQAIARVEGLLAAHVDDHPWGLEEKADELLQRLVTGTYVRPTRDHDGAPRPAPVAHALARSFVVTDGKVRVPMYLYGGDAATTERIGTLAIAEALREEKREACPLCDDRLSAHTMTSRSESWTRLPADRARHDDALVVFWFDLGARKVPARYDALLPIPSADVVARLEKGEGVIAVRRREGAPPIVLLGAPRGAQLGDVEEAFAAMQDLPSAPVSIALSPALRPSEIKGVVRSARPAMKACADALLAKSPSAAGKIVLRFEIVDGAPTKLEIDPSSALDEPTFLACIRAATTTLSFPKTGAATKVTYPVIVTPGG